MNARQFSAKLNAVAKAFRLAGGKHPFVRVDGEKIEIIERPPNSTDSDEAAKTQALIDERLGGCR